MAVDIRQQAVNYLSTKPRTRLQVIRHLKGKGFAEEDIREAIAELEEYGYINDLEYCRMYFQYGFEKGRGSARIRHELAGKGVSSETIEAAYEELEDIPDEYEAAAAIAEAMLTTVDMDGLEHDERRRLRGRVGRRLLSRGLSSDTVYKVIRKLI